MRERSLSLANAAVSNSLGGMDFTFLAKCGPKTLLSVQMFQLGPTWSSTQNQNMVLSDHPERLLCLCLSFDLPSIHPLRN